MKRFSRITLTILAAMLPTAAAAADTIEQSDIFTPGTNIEWNEHHLEVFDKAAHRAFHVEWAQREREWLADHQSNDPDFAQLRRMWVRERNIEHRAWHRRQAAHEAAMSFMEANIPSVTSEWTYIVPTVINTMMPPRAGYTTSLPAAGDMPLPTRFYTERLSRRGLRAETQKRFAAEVDALMKRQEKMKK